MVCIRSINFQERFRRRTFSRTSDRRSI
ncbi:unnamed protein product [Debaryomyces tyrocola]|nr:unnamed protein product [Debaryomyces tyrocola]